MGRRKRGKWESPRHLRGKKGGSRKVERIAGSLLNQVKGSGWVFDALGKKGGIHQLAKGKRRGGEEGGGLVKRWDF